MNFVKLISDSILVGFKAGAGLTVAMTQLPSLIGTAGGGHNFFERAVWFVGQLGETHFLVLAVGAVAITLPITGERWLPGKPVALGVVALSIVAASVFELPALGVPTTGRIPAGLPTLEGPALRLRDVEGIVPLAAGCLLLVLRVIQRIHKRVTMCNTGHGLGWGAMAQQVCVVVSAAEREQLAAIAADRNRPRKHVERARIMLASADRHSAQRAQTIGVSRPTVWRWQQRFAERG